MPDNLKPHLDNLLNILENKPVFTDRINDDVLGKAFQYWIQTTLEEPGLLKDLEETDLEGIYEPLKDVFLLFDLTFRITKLHNSAKDPEGKVQNLVGDLIKVIDNFQKDDSIGKFLKDETTIAPRNLHKLSLGLTQNQLDLFSRETLFKAKKLRDNQLRINEDRKRKIESKKEAGDKIIKTDRTMLSMNVKNGIEFSVNEERAINALVSLISKSVQDGTLKDIPELSKAVLKVRLSDFYDLFGVPKHITGKDKKFRFSGKERELADSGLLELQKKLFLIRYEEDVIKLVRDKRGTMKEERIRKVRETITPLICPTSYTQEMEYKLDEYGNEKHQIVSEGYLIVLVDMIFYNNLTKNYYTLPKYLNHDVKIALNGKKAGSAVWNFQRYVHYLAHHAKNGSSEISYDKLVDEIGLMRYKEQGRKKLITKNIDEAFKIAMIRGVLSDVVQFPRNGKLIYKLVFNGSRLAKTLDLNLEEGRGR